jgi:hypothetical protein
MDATAFLNELNIRLGDTDNFTFSTEEKTSAVTEAINDQYVVEEVLDSSLTYANGTWQYAVPSGVTVVQELLMNISQDSGAPDRISNEAWEVVGNTINIDYRYRDTLRDGRTLYIKGLNKPDNTDTITNKGLQEYVLALALYNTLKTLTNKKMNRFLKNDTTMAELINVRGLMWRDVEEYRKRVRRQYVSA